MHDQLLALQLDLTGLEFCVLSSLHLLESNDRVMLVTTVLLIADQRLAHRY